MSFGHVERKAIADSEMHEFLLAVLIVRSCMKNTYFSLKKFIASPKCKPRSSFARNFKFCLSIFSFNFTPTKPLVPNVQVRNMFWQNVAWTSCHPLEIGPWTCDVVLGHVQRFCFVPRSFSTPTMLEVALAPKLVPYSSEWNLSGV